MGKRKSQAALDGRILDDLFEVVDSRREADPAQSYTAKLFKKGPEKIAQKLGEEAVEAVIEGALGRKSELAAESADLLYHLTVLWAACGLRPADVWQALSERRGVSGHVFRAAKNGNNRRERGER